MDTNLSELEERFYDILIEIDVGLRGRTIIMHDYLNMIPQILKEINSKIKDHLLSKKLLHNLLYTYYHMVLQFDYARYDSIPKEKRKEVREAIISFETYIISFLQYKSLETKDLKNEYTDRLEDYINNYLIERDKDNLINLLNNIRTNTVNEKMISRQLAYNLFLLQRKFLWETNYLKEPVVTRDELKSDEDFKMYMVISGYVYNIFSQNESI